MSEKVGKGTATSGDASAPRATTIVTRTKKGRDQRPAPQKEVKNA